MVEGVEADDVIGTLAREAERHGMNVIVSTGDKDLAQLVTDHVTLVNTMTNETLDRDGVIAKFGVPERIIDYLALIGDTVDNVPGVEKCGPKTAVKWLAQYDSLDGVIEHVGDIKGVVGDNLRRALDFLPLGRKLVTVETACDLAPHLESIEASLKTDGEARDLLRDIFARYGFKTWLREVDSAPAEGGGADAPEGEPAPVVAADIVREYDTIQTRRNSTRGSRRSTRPSHRIRHRDDRARPDARAARGPVVLGRAGQGGVSAGCASRPRHARTACSTKCSRA